MLTCSGFLLQLRLRERIVEHPQLYKGHECLQTSQGAMKLALKDLDELKRTVHEKLLAVGKEIQAVHLEIHESRQELESQKGHESRIYYIRTYNSTGIANEL